MALTSLSLNTLYFICSHPEFLMAYQYYPGAMKGQRKTLSGPD